LVLAVLVTAGMSAVGLIVAAAAAQAAAPPPNPDMTGLTSTGGPFTVTWTPAVKTDVFQRETLTIGWTPPSNTPNIPTPGTGPFTVRGSCAAGVLVPTVCTYQWPPELISAGYVLNTTYQLVATAQDCRVLTNNCTTDTISQSVPVAFPPTPPANVAAVTAHGGSQATITWDPNPEPDIVSYEVFRDTTSIAHVNVTPSTTTTYTDAPTKDGTYVYSVRALRYGATYSGTVASDTTAAPTAVKLTNTASNPTTTTSTTKPGGGTGTLPPVLNSAKPPSGHTSLKASPTVGGGVALSPTAPTSVDPGFQPVLPYTQPPATDPGTTDPAVISTPPAHKAGHNSVAALAAVSGGLLIAVIAMHGLWLRSEVRHGGTLEVLDPDR
jgi:hypothetical protein